MAGHSKWANIQHRKSAQDAKRGKLFTRLIREISIAARIGGGDAESNPRLRTAIDKALGNNMTRDTVERAVKRGAGALDNANVEEVRYEGYGPGGVAVMVECMTDNRNRTVGEIRHAFSKCGGNLGTDGSVAYLFSKNGILHYPAGTQEDVIMEIALEAGAEDIVSDEDGTLAVLTAADDFMRVKEILVRAGHAPETAELTWRALTAAPLDIEDAKKMLKLNDMLEEIDDVQNVYSNAELPDELLAELEQD